MTSFMEFMAIRCLSLVRFDACCLRKEDKQCFDDTTLTVLIFLINCQQPEQQPAGVPEWSGGTKLIPGGDLMETKGVERFLCWENFEN